MRRGILERTSDRGNPRVVLLSGGVGGARMARGLAAVLPPDALTIVVNVGDDEVVYGLYVSPDVDTVTYTLAGMEGEEGWGVAGDTFTVMAHLAGFDVDTTFRLGDRDLALNMARSMALAAGEDLSAITRRLAKELGVGHDILPASDDRIRTRVRTTTGEWLPFQEYFVVRRHRDEVAAVEFAGAADAAPAPGVREAIADAALVVVAPSNPVLSIWPILAVPAIAGAMAQRKVVAISPLFGGRAVKGPAADVLKALGHPPGNLGVAAAYEGLLWGIVIDEGDAADREALESAGLAVGVTDTRIAEGPAAARLTRWMLEWAS